jgi:N6-L-threonylcarbamoyladenine synthase/protein kinase Bud32
MVDVMAGERGGNSFAPPPSLAVDNGSMIAYLGEKMHSAGISHDLDDTTIDQRFRTDMVDVIWKDRKEILTITTPGTVNLEIGGTVDEGEVLGRGAEALITSSMFGDILTVEKFRFPKGYRTKEMETRITGQRIRNEARMLRGFRSIGIRTPFVLDVDMDKQVIIMELLKGPRLASLLNILPEREQEGALLEMGRMIGTIHENNMVHGDLTTSNFILLKKGTIPELGLIDCSLAERTEELEKKGVDLRLFFEVFYSTHEPLGPLEERFWEGYFEMNPEAEKVRGKLNDITNRGRYIAERWP